MVGPRTFEFLNEKGSLADGAWDLEKSKLWLYNLHYFDDLNAEGAVERLPWHRTLMARWITENPAGRGAGWEPYPTSLRIVNWIKWRWAGNVFEGGAAQSLAVQARWLSRRLETHLLGNHLLANAKALTFAGCCFEGPEAEAWLRRGMGILLREIPEQVLSDGGHFERSTMYHALALEDILDLLNLVGAHPEVFAPWTDFVDQLPEIARRMVRWLSLMCHPDGEIAFFNDAATGIAPTPAALAAYARRLEVEVTGTLDRDGVVWLESSGYVRAERGGAVLIADVGPVGPDYLPGHAHADTLTFELSLGNQRVVVNSGTSCYGRSEQRERERGTAAHNTVEVEGLDSSEVWAGFRVGRRARPFDVSVQRERGGVAIQGAHDGYVQLGREVIHRRRWDLGDGTLAVTDRLEGPPVRGIGRIHFHPAVQLDSGGGPTGEARWCGGSLRWETSDCEPGVAESTWHPEFGVSLPSRHLVLPFGVDGASRCRFVLRWSPPDA
jgi:uncharacterized heparinase superfamily protein